MSKRKILYSKLTQMEPMLPSDSSGELQDLVIEVVRCSAALGSSVHRETARGVAELVRSMNSYYSNLIEGHNTHPVEHRKGSGKRLLGGSRKARAPDGERRAYRSAASG